MASYNLTSSDHGVYEKTLAANTVDTINFGKDVDRVEIVSNGSSPLDVTVDGTTPTVSGTGGFHLPSGGVVVREIVVPTAGNTVVKLISAGTPTYSVAEISS